eukprot:6994964-Prymnesium_polylepis.3
MESCRRGTAYGVTVHIGDTSAFDRAHDHSKGSAYMHSHGLHSNSNVARVCSACIWMARQVYSSSLLLTLGAYDAVSRVFTARASGVASL